MNGAVRMVVWGGIAGLILALVVEACHIELLGNLHAVIPNRAYRCGQPSPERLDKLIREYHIRTLINLRGVQSPAPWYLAECRTTSNHDVSQEDICLSAGRMPCAHEIKHLIDILDHCEYPVLFHCQRGADRTGLASAILLLMRSDASLSDARRQLGPRYGHLAVGKPEQLDRFLDLYEAWLKDNGLEHHRSAFLRWLDEGYRQYSVEWELVDRPKAVGASEGSIFLVRAHNVSTQPWHFQSARSAGFHATYYVRDPDNHPAYQGRAGLFEATVNPGEFIDLKVVVPALHYPGCYRLTVDLTDEQFCVFCQIGAEPLVLEFEVQ
jgi:protein tyrosine phosphatase (PTP) superfamily phosphohydrolase (DUF442 family)